MSTLHPSFSAAIERTSTAMRDYSRTVKTERWHGMDISKRPEAEMREVIGWDFRVPMGPPHDLEHFAGQIEPNLPWADDHFQERVCGFPMNPGKEWENWPWARSAGEFRDGKGRFEVNYMERFWAGGVFVDTPDEGLRNSLTGIRGRPYGDLESIIKLLAKEPLTRQAWLPIYFPEDTGAGGRVPCSLGYHWIMRNGYLHVHYPIRSCDFYRHFRDDIYLAVRMTLWLLERLKEAAPNAWSDVRPGYFSMWVGSLHVFVNDYIKLFGAESQSNVKTPSR